MLPSYGGFGNFIFVSSLAAFVKRCATFHYGFTVKDVPRASEFDMVPGSAFRSVSRNPRSLSYRRFAETTVRIATA
jgi:hypothetical protein